LENKTLTEKDFATGQCLCGQVKYTCSAKPLKMIQCHCEDCKKTSGTGHVSFAFFKENDVEIKGESSSYGSLTDSGSTITRYFCPTCGSRLFGKNSRSESVIGVAAGTLEDSSWFKPDLIVYNKRKQDWDFMDESIPVFEEMPPL